VQKLNTLLSHKENLNLANWKLIPQSSCLKYEYMWRELATGTVRQILQSALPISVVIRVLEKTSCHQLIK